MWDADIVRWANVALASIVVVAMVAGTVARWDIMPSRLRRIVPWVILTYVVIAYGSGEVASSTEPVDPGLRVFLLVGTLSGLAIALLYKIHDDTYDLED